MPTNAPCRGIADRAGKMADTFGSLEQATAGSRAQLADTFDRIGNPETFRAATRNSIDAMCKAKGGALDLADGLKLRAQDNPFAVGLIGAGVGCQLSKRP